MWGNGVYNTLTIISINLLQLGKRCRSVQETWRFFPWNGILLIKLISFTEIWGDINNGLVTKILGIYQFYWNAASPWEFSMGHTNYSGIYQEPSWESIGGLEYRRFSPRWNEIWFIAYGDLLDGHNHLGAMRGDRKVGGGGTALNPQKISYLF